MALSITQNIFNDPTFQSLQSSVLLRHADEYNNKLNCITKLTKLIPSCFTTKNLYIS